VDPINDVAALVRQLQQLGVAITADGDRLKIDAPKGRLSAEIRSLIVANKSELLAFCRSTHPDASPTPNSLLIPPIQRTERLDASFAQQRMWFLDRLDGGGDAYAIPILLRAEGDLHRAFFIRAVDEIIRRHEVLRTIFRDPEGDEDTPRQVILPPFNMTVPLIDLCTTAESERLAKVFTIAHEAASERFDLATGPLIRMMLLNTRPNEHFVLLTLHHIIFDGLSFAVFLKELRVLYESFLQGLSSPLPALEIQYADYSAWQRKQLTTTALTESLAFWKSHLAGAPTLLELPTDHPRPPLQTFRGARVPFVLDEDLTARLRELSKAQGATLFTTLYAAFAVLLSRYTDQHDLVIGVPASGRNHHSLEPLIGLFVNTLALRCQVDRDKRFVDLLDQVKTMLIHAYRHQELPFQQLIRELDVERSLANNPLFQVMIAFQDNHSERYRLSGVEFSVPEFDHTIAKFDLTLILHEGPTTLSGNIEYNTDLFERATTERMVGHWQVLLRAIADDPRTIIGRLPLLTNSEEQQILYVFNREENVQSVEKCFPQLFEEQAARTPNAVAAVFNEQTISFDELNRRSNAWAWQLVQHGVLPGAIVALVAERNIDYLTAFIAILKAGAVYLPGDPTHPPERLDQMLQQSRAVVVLTENAELGALRAMQSPTHLAQRTILSFDELDELRKDEGNLPTLRGPEDLAYVIFTSGSTGTPKGAMVHHQGLVNHLYAMVHELTLTAADRIAQNAPQMFDISIWQFLVGGVVGAAVHILDRETASNPAQLLNAIEQQKITILEVVPSLMRVTLEMIEQLSIPPQRIESLRWLIPTGEALPPSLARLWLTKFPSIPLINAYGPAECSDDVTVYPLHTLPDETMRNMPVGRPIENMRVYLLDTYRKLVPIGLPGELYVAGVGVGLGYLDDDEKTREAFSSDPFSLQPNRRIYKTGDIGRWLPDGNIEYLGRADHQVKIRGFRIELGEIESILAQHPSVQQAVVVARSDSAQAIGTEKQLVAYVGLSEPLENAAVELRSWLKARLPDYMLPAAIAVLHEFPLSSNGKIDRRALLERPLDTGARTTASGYTPPRDNLELRLVQCWGRLLDVSPIGVLDNFFEIGGDSLLAIRLVNNIQREFGIKLPLHSLFQHGTIERLAALLRRTATPSTWSPLVCLQHRGPKTPLFFVHAAGGIVFRYLQVAALLGTERPFYGLQARGVEPGDPFYANIEEMAADYVAAIRTVQPTGPYLLGGWSFGGTVAFAMARILEKAGQSVPLVIMVDAPSPFVDSFAEDDVDFLLERLGPAAGLTLDAIDQHSSRDAKLAYLIQEQRLAGLFAPDIDDAYARHRLALHKHHNEISCHYRPDGAINGKIVFYKPTETIPFDVRMKEPTVEWIPFAKGGIDVDDAPGNHFNMFSATNGPVLADKLRVCLAQNAYLFDKH
jgi:amino acid adenylation domain-containing protein